MNVSLAILYMENTCMTASYYQDRMFWPIPAIIFFYWNVCIKPGKWAVMYMWVMNIDFASVCKIFLFYSGIIPIVWYVFYFSSYYIRCSHFSVDSYYTGVSFDQYCNQTKTVNISLFLKVIQSSLIGRLLFNV